ncbi:MAG: alkaline phosphatase family protein [Acidobacteriota bacterium]
MSSLSGQSGKRGGGGRRRLPWGAAAAVAAALVAVGVLLLGRPWDREGERARGETKVPPEVAETGTKVAIIGLDGADWQIIGPLIEEGSLPNLAALREHGAWGNMKSMKPTLSPLLWTTVVTGRPPEEHGIIDFLMMDPSAGKAVPVSSRWRRTKALWNIFSDVGKSSAFIAWWASWPAEPVLGRIVSDRVAYSLFGYESDAGDLAGATYPPVYFEEIRPLIVGEESISLREVQQFVSIDAREFREHRARIAKDPRAGHRDPVNHLVKILASARTYHAIALDILERGQPDLFGLYYQGIDEVCHRFAHYMPPRMDMVSEGEYAKYRAAVFNYYRYQDRLLGEILEALEPGTVIILMSDHGFRSGGGRPTTDPPYIEGKPGLWHRRYGIIVLSGPAIRPTHLDTSSLLDIAPTVLYLAGLPVAEDMGGRILAEAIGGDFRARFPVRTIPTYETVGGPVAPAIDAIADSGVDEEMVERLRSLGYIGGSAEGAPGAGSGELTPPAPEGQVLVTGYLNEASLHLKNKDYAKAEAAIDRVLKSAPAFTPGLILAAQLYQEQKRYGAAIDALRKVLDMDPEGEPQAFIRLGEVYSESERREEGIAYLRRQAERHPDIGEIRAALGSILLKAGDAAAERELLRAVRINPALGEPLSELHTIYQGTDKVLALEPIVRRGLELNDQSVVHHNWMGLIYQWKGQIDFAEKEFLLAMELDPDYAATMSNLGALYGRSGRLAEAVEILGRAVEKDSDNLEAWVNLGAALGRLRRPREAIRALETARRKGLRTTTLYNALALAYLQDGQRDRALEYLHDSLALDPDQQDARDLLREINRTS